MRKKSILIILAIVVLAAFGSGTLALGKTNNRATDVVQAGKTELYQQCEQNMPKDAAQLETWHNSPEHQKLHQEMTSEDGMQAMHQGMMSENTDMQSMHQQMMADTTNTQATHSAHHEKQG